MTQFLRDQASDSEEVVTPLMLDGTYLSRNFATLGPLTRAAAGVIKDDSISERPRMTRLNLPAGLQFPDEARMIERALERAKDHHGNALMILEEPSRGRGDEASVRSSSQPMVRELSQDASEIDGLQRPWKRKAERPLVIDDLSLPTSSSPWN